MRIIALTNKKIILSLLLISTIIRVAYIFLTKDIEHALWVSICFSWPLWVIYAFLYDKDMYGPFNWNNGENKIGRVAITVLVFIVYFILLFKDL